MTEVMKAMLKFFSQFGVPAYPEDGVPSDAVLPYITYSPVVASWDEDTTTHARVWDRSTSYTRICRIVDQIGDKIGSGIAVSLGYGYLYLYKGTPWSQMQPTASNSDEDDVEVKICYLNIGISTIV